jgi:iron complex outermembrane recepter protein
MTSKFPFTALLFVVATTPAVAQTPPAPADAASAPANAQQITVTGIRQKATATKQDAELRDLPQSVSIVSEQTIQDRAYTRIEDLANTLPNLQANTPYYGGVSQGFYSRGFSNTGVLVDGYSSGASFGGSSNIYDLISVQQVEALRGPASVLYGQGNPGGVVNLNLKRPLKAFGFAIEGQKESTGPQRLEFDWNQPLAPGLAMRWVGSVEDYESFRDFVTIQRYYVSPAVRWQPDAQTTVDVLLQLGDFRFPYDEGFPRSRDAVRNADVRRSYLEQWNPQRRTTVQSLRVEATRQVTPQWAVTAGYFENRQKLNEGASIAFRGLIDGTTQVERYLRDERPADQNRSRDRTASLRARGAFDLAGMQHQLVLGAEASRSFSIYSVFSAPVDPIDYIDPVYGVAPVVRAGTEFLFAGGYGVSTTALFVNDLITLAPQWKLQLGLRHDRIASSSYSDALFTLSDRTQDSRNTPSIGVVWQPTKSSAVYASYGASFVPQPFRNRLGAVLDPEIGRAFELGLKQELLEGKLALTGAVFSIDKSGILQSDPVDDNFVINGGTARSRGFELELQGRLPTGTELSAGVGLADAKWIKSTDFPIGERLPGASKVTAVLSAKQPLHLAWLPQGSWVSAALNYGSKREWLAPADDYKLPAYTRLDLGAAVPIGDAFELQFNVKNATDERITSANGFGIVIPEAPRTFGLTLRWKTGAL